MPPVGHVAQPICLEVALLNKPYLTSGECGECPVKMLLEKHYQVSPGYWKYGVWGDGGVEDWAVSS